jgi:nickel-dependent lactate racemase
MELNSVKEDAFEAVRLAGIDFALNLSVGYQGKLLACYAGSFDETLGMAVYGLGSSYQVEASAGADIVVVSAGGSKFDYDLYSAAWALQSAGKLAKKGAAIILLAECSDGLGADGFASLAGIDQPEEFERRYQLGAEAMQLLKATAAKNEVWLVSSLPRLYVEPLGVKMAQTANEAYARACEQRRSKRTIVIPYGCSSIPNISA